MDPAAKRERLVKTRPLPENMKRRPLTDARAAAAQKQRQATRAKESALPEVNAAAVVDLAIAVIFWGALYYFWNHTAVRRCGKGLGRRAHCTLSFVLAY